MTPKEKANKLVDHYLGTIIFNVSESIDVSIIPAAKRCALICVDEIQEHAQMVDGEYEGYTNAWNYFNVVKQEIKNI